MIAFIVANKVVFASFGVALIDLLFAVSPGLSGNGILHQILVWLGGLSNPPVPPAAK